MHRTCTKHFKLCTEDGAKISIYKEISTDYKVPESILRSVPQVSIFGVGKGGLRRIVRRFGGAMTEYGLEGEDCTDFRRLVYSPSA